MLHRSSTYGAAILACLVVLALALVRIAPAGITDPTGFIESHTPTTLKTATATEVSFVVRNTSSQRYFRIATSSLPFGWSVTNLTPGQKSIGYNKTATFKLLINPGLIVGPQSLSVQLYGDDDFGLEQLVENSSRSFSIMSPPGNFLIGSPAMYEVLEGPFIISWSPSEYVESYTLEIRRIVGGVPSGSTALKVTGLTGLSYSANTSAFIKGELYQIEMIAKNVVGETKNMDGPRFFSVKPPPALGAFAITSPTPSQITTRNPSFAWTASANATSYRLSIYGEFNGQPATGAAIRTINQAGLTYNWADPPLDRGKNYYCLVVASGEAGEKGSDSGYVKFSIPAIEAFSLISPTNEQTGVYRLTSFRWGRAEGATSYQISIFEEIDGRRNNYLQGVVSQPALPEVEYFLPANKPLLANRRYSWTVTAYAGNASRDSNDGRRFLHTMTMGQFFLLTPEPGQQDAPTVPTFTWSATTGAIGYIVQLTTPNGSGKPNEGAIQQSPAINGTSWPSTFAALTPGQKYFWRVYAGDGTNTILNYGSWQEFTVYPLQDFGLVSPADSATDIEISPVFQWQSVPLATGYRLHLSIPGSINLPVIDIPNNFTSVDLQDYDVRLNGSTVYSWTVEAYKGDLSQLSSESRQFTTTFRTLEQFTGCDIIDHLIGAQQLSALDRLVLSSDTPIDASYYYRYMAVPDRVPCE